MSTQASQIVGPFSFSGDEMHLTLTQKIMDMKARLGIIDAPYYHEEYKASDNEDDHHVDTVKKYKKDELVEPLS